MTVTINGSFSNSSNVDNDGTLNINGYYDGYYIEDRTIQKSVSLKNRIILITKYMYGVGHCGKNLCNKRKN